MKILFDHCVPRPLSRYFSDHIVETTVQNGWQALSNGKLLDAAEGAGFDAFITVDQNLPHQQNLSKRTIRVLILIAENILTATLARLAPIALVALSEIPPGALRQATSPLSDPDEK